MPNLATPVEVEPRRGSGGGLGPPREPLHYGGGGEPGGEADPGETLKLGVWVGLAGVATHRIGLHFMRAFWGTASFACVVYASAHRRYTVSHP